MAVRASGGGAEAVIFAGDLTNRREKAAYHKSRDGAEPVAAEVGAELTDRKRSDRLGRAAKPPGGMQVPHHLVPAAVSARPPWIGGIGPSPGVRGCG
jgi:hypothetical protein